MNLSKFRARRQPTVDRHRLFELAVQTVANVESTPLAHCRRNNAFIPLFEHDLRANARFAFVARENRFPLFRIML